MDHQQYGSNLVPPLGSESVEPETPAWLTLLGGVLLFLVLLVAVIAGSSDGEPAEGTGDPGVSKTE